MYQPVAFICERCHARELPYEGPSFVVIVLNVMMLSGVVSGFIGFCIGTEHSESDYRRNLTVVRNSMWREAVEAGHAIEVEGTNGTGYAWKER